jgi:glutamate 5-kinase
MKQRWVIKAGSQMVLGGGPLLIRHWMEQVEKLQEKNVEVIWVTSGAIALAKQKIGFKKQKRSLPEKQALSAIGQPLVMDQYLLALQFQSLRGAQVLLTSEDMSVPSRRKNLHNTLEQLLKWKYVPVLNENDAVATSEIQFGDNDALASQVAVMLKADKLILLTDVDGLFDKNPNKFKNAELIPHLTKISKSMLKATQDSGKSNSGTGGMYSKLLAAQRALKHRILTHLVRGDGSFNLLRILEGQNIGTCIVPEPKPRKHL